MTIKWVEILAAFCGLLAIALLLVVIPYLWIRCGRRFGTFFNFGPTRRTQECIVVNHLATIVDQQLPLGPGTACAADGERGIIQHRLAQIARFLAQGLPLSRALRLGLPGCSGAVTSIIAAGEQVGQLPAALAQVRQASNQTHHVREEIMPFLVPYFLVITTAVTTVVTLIMIIVMPKMQEIFADFGVAFDSALVRFLVSYPGQQLLQTLVYIGVIGVALFGYIRFIHRRLPQQSFFRRCVDTLRWWTPGWHRLQFHQGLATALRTMRFGTQAGLPLPDAIRLAANLDINWYLQQRLRHFASRVEQGTRMPAAADASGLGKVCSLALATGERSGDVSAALHYAADYHDALISRWWACVNVLVAPTTSLVMGVVVGFIAFSIFQPIVQLIEMNIHSSGLM